MADSELIIKIRSVLESQGTDAAKKALDDLSAAQDKQAKSASSADDALNDLRKQISQTRAEADKLAESVNGSTGELAQNSSAGFKLGETFGTLAAKVSLFVSTFTIGFQIGKAIGEWVNELNGANKAMDDAKIHAEAMHQNFVKVSQLRLDNFKKEIDSLTNGYSKAVDKAERLQRLSDMRDDAKLASDLSANELLFQRGSITKEERDTREINLRNASARRKLDQERTAIAQNESADANAEKSGSKMLKTLSDQARRAGSSVSSLENKTLLSESLAPDIFEMPMDRRRKKMMEAYDKNNDTNILRLLNAYQTRDDSQSKLDQFSPVYDKTLEQIGLRREERATQEQILRDRYAQLNATEQAQAAASSNKAQSAITAGQQAWQEQFKTPRQKALETYQDLRSRLSVTPFTAQDESGVPLNAAGQAAESERRRQQGEALLKKAGQYVNQGQDVEQIFTQLSAALQKVGVYLSGVDDLRASIRNLDTRMQSAESRERVSSGLN